MMLLPRKPFAAGDNVSFCHILPPVDINIPQNQKKSAFDGLPAYSRN